MEGKKSSQSEGPDLTFIGSGGPCSSENKDESSHYYSATGQRCSESDDSQNNESVGMSQGGSVYYLPKVYPSCVPVVGMLFKSLDEGVNFYNNYASAAGFVTRLSTLKKAYGSISLRRIVCNKQGFKSSSSHPKTRSRGHVRFGCSAYIIFIADKVSGFFKVTKFEPRHAHTFTPCKEFQFMSSNRKLNIGHKKFVMDCEKANIGPVRSHRIFKEIVGSYDQVGASAVDFKNYRRDMLAYIGGSDAQMTINKFLKKKELCSAFFFEYDVDSDDRLTRLFGADPICRKNYSIFGDVVSFDATYRTNRYNLIFIPFTGLDHHKSSITFAAGLIFKEDAGSYVWLLQKFKEAMSFDPKIIMTDQDGSMKIAVEQVFPQSLHRLCIWHIMKKVPGKTKYDVEAGDEFRSKLNRIVWSVDLEPIEFEAQWAVLLNEYPLVKRQWFDDMFAIRKSWIPAYFRNTMFGGLLKTTSISESANSFYGDYVDRYYRLVELVMHFDIGLDCQRHRQSRLNFESSSVRPDLGNLWGLEEHAAEVYTLSVFAIVKKQLLCASTSCCLVSIVEESGTKLYGIQDLNSSKYSVSHHLDVDEFSCSCCMFIMVGLPCRHMFLVFRNLGLSKIPSKYVIPRWTKSAMTSPVFTFDDKVVLKCSLMEERECVMNQLISDFYSCVGLLEDNNEQLKLFGKFMKERKDSLLSESVDGCSVSTSNLSYLEKYCGIEVPSDVHIHPPDQAKNKGSGSRIRSGKEVSMLARNPKKRRCGRCNKFATHNSRTCTEDMDT